MNPETAAARLSMALRPGLGITKSNRAFNALAYYLDFAREVHAEAGPTVLANIVRAVERNAVLTGRAA